LSSSIIVGSHLPCTNASRIAVGMDAWNVSGPAVITPLSTFATLKTTTEPRDLKKFQQLNAVRIQGVVPPGVPLDQA